MNFASIAILRVLDQENIRNVTVEFLLTILWRAPDPVTGSFQWTGRSEKFSGAKMSPLFPILFKIDSRV
jgi:hypothetical protein